MPSHREVKMAISPERVSEAYSCCSVGSTLAASVPVDYDTGPTRWSVSVMCKGEVLEKAEAWVKDTGEEQRSQALRCS